MKLKFSNRRYDISIWKKCTEEGRLSIRDKLRDLTLRLEVDYRGNLFLEFENNGERWGKAINPENDEFLLWFNLVCKQYERDGEPIDREVFLGAVKYFIELEVQTMNKYILGGR